MVPKFLKLTFLAGVIFALTPNLYAIALMSPVGEKCTFEVTGTECDPDHDAAYQGAIQVAQQESCVAACGGEAGGHNTISCEYFEDEEEGNYWCCEAHVWCFNVECEIPEDCRSSIVSSQGASVQTV